MIVYKFIIDNFILKCRHLTMNEKRKLHNLKSNCQNKKLKRFKANLEKTPLNLSDYYIENGIRKVYPYPFTFSAFCKERWIGKTLNELFTTEFRALSPDSINYRISKEYLKVNNKSVPGDYNLRNNDIITHRIHRHEFPVLAVPIPIILINDELVVIDKPPSLPIHSCGKYYLNTIKALLEKENNIKDLHVIHRLDRLTSGIMIFARTDERAKLLHEEMRNREMHKEYVCRVEGYFPDGIVECDKPIGTLSHRIGICIVSPNGKPCKTIFERLNFNGKSSTVLCKPLTGRMHQIRVHLQYLGHPIINDHLYNSAAFGEQRGRLGEYGKSIEQLIKDIENTHQKDYYVIPENEDIDVYNSNRLQDPKNSIALKALQHYFSQSRWDEIKKNYEFQPSKLIKEDDCDECKVRTVDPTPSEQLIYLHALRYKGKDWCFETQMPIWAQESWIYD